MATNELSITGQKKVGTLMKEFTKKFPYLGLRLYRPESKKLLGTGTNFAPYRIPVDKTLASVRAESATGGTITITGNKKIKTLEHEFEKVFGLFAQVCFSPKELSSHQGYITNTEADEYTLSSFNRMREESKDNLYQYEEFK